jgi:hypothetical protein
MKRVAFYLCWLSMKMRRIKADSLASSLSPLLSSSTIPISSSICVKDLFHEQRLRHSQSLTSSFMKCL